MGIAATLGFFVLTTFTEGLTGVMLFSGLEALTLLNIGTWFSKAEKKVEADVSHRPSPWCQGTRAHYVS